jgi:WD40 repeat protein
MLAASNGDGTLGLWQVASGANIATLRQASPAVNSSLASSLAFSPTGTILAASYNEVTVTLWSVATRRVLATVGGTAGQVVHSLAFSPDGRLLAIGSSGSPQASGPSAGAVTLWDVARNQVVGTFTGTSTGRGALACSRQEVASVSRQGRVSLWSLAATGSHSSPLAVLANPKSNAKSIAFTPDGTQLMSGNNDGTGTIWSRATRKVTRTLDTGATDRVPSVAFRPGTAGLACGGTNLVMWT